MNNYIGTYNGGQFWVTKPDEKDISFEEITHALASNVRFNGHTNIFWSVAQHSLLVAEIALDIHEKYTGELKMQEIVELYLAALTHDFSEAYISDIARPFKKYLVDYVNYEKDVQNKIHKTVGLTGTSRKYSSIVAEADTLALAVETTVMLNPCEQWKLDYDYLEDERIELYTPKIKSKCPDIIQAKLLNMLITGMNNLGEINSYKNNSEIMEIHLNNKIGFLPIIKQGVKIADVKELDNNYIILYKGEKLEYNKEFIDNTMDLQKLLLRG